MNQGPALRSASAAGTAAAPTSDPFDLEPPIGHSRGQHETGAHSAAGTTSGDHAFVPGDRTPGNGMRGRGVVVISFTVTSAVCLIGLLVSGATAIPHATGWALVLTAWAGAAMIKLHERWTTVFAPPLVLAAVVAVLGQITLFGAFPSLAREMSMFWSAMATLAPMQVLAVGGSAAIVWWRQRRTTQA